MQLSEPTTINREVRHSRDHLARSDDPYRNRPAPLIGEVFGWLAAREIPPSGPPFFKYNVIDMDGELEIEVGVPVATEVSGDGRVHGGVLPAGRYATLHHIGHPSTLVDATEALLAWAHQNGLSWDTSDTDGSERWTARLEEYPVGPDDTPDMDKYEADLAFKLAD